MKEEFPKPASLKNKIVKAAGAAAIVGAAAFGVHKALETENEKQAKEMPVESVPSPDEPFSRRYERFSRSLEGKSRDEIKQEIHRMILERLTNLELHYHKGEVDILNVKGDKDKLDRHLERSAKEFDEIRLQMKALLQVAQERFSLKEVNELITSIFNNINLNAKDSEMSVRLIISEFEAAKERDDFEFRNKAATSPKFSAMEPFIYAVNRLSPEKGRILRAKLYEVCTSNVFWVSQITHLLWKVNDEVAGRAMLSPKEKADLILEIEEKIQKLNTTIAFKESYFVAEKADPKNREDEERVDRDKREFKEELIKIRARGYQIKGSPNF